MLLYVIWEASLALCGAGLALVLSKDARGEEDSAALFLACALFFKLILGCLIPQTLLLAGAVSALNLMICGLACSLVGGVLLRQRKDALLRLFPEGLNKYFFPAGLGLLALASFWPMAILPITETDSIANSHNILFAMSNRITIFDFNHHYVALWELGHIPGFLLSGNAWVGSFFSVQAVILFALCVFISAREMNCPFGLSCLIALAALIHPMFLNLHGATGVATLKNDVIAGAGTLGLVCGMLRLARQEKFEASGACLFTCGAVFAATKYNGPFNAGLLPLLWALLFFRRRDLPIRISARACAGLAGCAALFLFSVGLYYIHNWLAFGNPVYPMPMNFGPVSLPGDFDVKNTKLIEHIADTRMWSFIFGLKLAFGSVSGILAPFVNLAALPMVPILILRKEKFADAKSLLLIWCFTVALWLLFFCTPWSAGDAREPYYYIGTHNTMRYIFAGQQLSLVLLIVALSRHGRWGNNWAWGLLLVEFAGRYLVLWKNLPAKQHWPWLLVSIACVAVCFLLLRRARIVFAGALFWLALFMGAEKTYLANKKIDWPWIGGDHFGAVEAAGPEIAGKEVWLIVPGKHDHDFSTRFFPNAFAASGYDFRLRYQGRADLERLLAEEDIFRPYALVFCSLEREIQLEDIRRLNDLLQPLGYVEIRSGRGGSALFVLGEPHE